MFLSHRGASNEYLQHMLFFFFLRRNGENYPMIKLSAKNFTLSAKGLTDNYYANSRHQWVDGSTFVRACVYMYILISKVTSVRKSNNLPCVLFSKLNLLR